MTWQPNIRIVDGKEQVFCDWRRKFVRLTPEERVRQYFLHMLVEDYCYPMNLLAVEYQISVAGLNKRCDAVIFSRTLQPLCIIEFKAPDVPLTQAVFDQVAIYNRRLNVSLCVVSNGRETCVSRVTPAGYDFLPQIPRYEEM